MYAFFKKYGTDCVRICYLWENFRMDIQLVRPGKRGDLHKWSGSCIDIACLVTVCAAGWKTYSGYYKFGSQEPALDEERYRFIAVH